MTAGLIKVYLVVLSVTSVFFLLNTISLLQPGEATSLTGLFLVASGQLVLCVVIWFFVHFGYHFYHRSGAPKDSIDFGGFAILITGCDTGFGHQAALHFAKIGYFVYAGVLDVNGPGAEKLRTSGSELIKVVQMDVTNDKQVKDVANEIKNSYFNLWAVVNNAGIMYNSFIEFGNEIDNCKAQFEVNTFGPLRVVKACLPLLRESQGRVVTVTSIAAHLNFAMSGVYGGSKHATRAMFNALRDEVEPFGIKVVTIEPTGFDTELTKKMTNHFHQLLDETDENVIRDYTKTYGDLKEGFESSRKKTTVMVRSDLNEVISAIEKGLMCKEPKFCYRVTGSWFRPIIWWWSMLADEVTSWINWLVFDKSFKITRSERREY